MVLLNCFDSPEIGVFDRCEPRYFFHFDSCGQDTQKRQVMAPAEFEDNHGQATYPNSVSGLKIEETQIALPGCLMGWLFLYEDALCFNSLRLTLQTLPHDFLLTFITS